MNETEYLITCLAEECSEVTKACSKVLRFGLENHHPRDKTITNKHVLLYELNDLMSVVEILIERGVIPAKWESYSQRSEKAEKVIHYMKDRDTTPAIRCGPIKRD